MPRFWLATFTQGPYALPAIVDASAAPLLAAASRNLAVEVLCEESTQEYAVLFSTVDDPETPNELRCLVGFTNTAKTCNVWRDRGIPLIDARIVLDETTGLSVFSPFFGADPPMQYESLLFTLTGMPPADSPGGEAHTLETRYEQALEAPDGAQPETLITRRAVRWTPQRSNVRRHEPADFRVTTTPTRYPSLAPLGGQPPALTPG
jgi:hypothetical protein